MMTISSFRQNLRLVLTAGLVARVVLPVLLWAVSAGAFAGDPANPLAVLEVTGAVVVVVPSAKPLKVHSLRADQTLTPEGQVRGEG